jgi:hypothetical protein
LVAETGHDLGRHLLNELRSPGGNDGRHFERAGDLSGNFDLEKIRQRLIDRGEVLLNNLVSLLTVRFLDLVFDCLDRLIARENA